MISPILHRFDSVGSTNDIALDMARSGAVEGTVVLARTQSKGRGRRGRAWFDKPGESIILSAILRPELPLSRYSELGFSAAVAVAETVEAECGLRPQLKWPNDVLVRDKKLCGILIECAKVGTAHAGQSPFSQSAAIVGIGVNVKQTAFPPDLSTKATSIALEGGRCADVESLTQSVIARLFSVSALGFEEILTCWRKYMWGVGREVEVATEDETITGVITGIDSDGALLVDQDGHPRRIIASIGITQT